MRYVRLLFFFLVVTSSLPAGTFTVSSLSGGTNSGSLYAAITSINSSAGANTITFATNGTIILSNNLPLISNQANINGMTAPGWSGTPVVTINFNTYSGFVFASGSTGSLIQGLSLVNASNAAVTLNGSSNIIFGNYIGVLADGITPAGNQGDGIFVSSSSVDNTIGSTNTNPTVFALANIISRNANNGINLVGSSGNQITMNYIGTDVTGLVNEGNSNDGILLASNAFGNVIGGPAYGSNNPTGTEGAVAPVFQRPPQGNLISGNGSHGVEIATGASSNTLMGNYIGTDATGNAALGNTGNGLLINAAPSNSVIGCFATNNPFVFYNVISGNGANGVEVTNANYTTIQGDFLGIGCSNDKIIPNMNNGVLVAGTSTFTQIGGVIPLGSVISGNNGNGTEIKDSVSCCTNFNTFGGGFAFGGAAPNMQDGLHYHATGSNNLIRTCIMGGNIGNGIHITGTATGLQITDTGCGVTSELNRALPNQQNGILIDGDTSIVGLFDSSIEPRITLSGNARYGLAFDGTAHGNFVYHAYIGLSGDGSNENLGNGQGGVFFGPGTYNNTVGGDPNVSTNYETTIAYNLGSGISINNSLSNTILFCPIFSNTAYGIIAYGDCSGTRIESNNILNNDLGTYYLMHAYGITIVP